MSKRSREDEENEKKEVTGITLDQLHEIAKRRKQEREDKTRQEVETDADDDSGSSSTDEVSKDADSEKEEDVEGLPLLTQHELKVRSGPVKYQLPNWVAQFCPIEGDITANSVSLETFNIHQKVVLNLESMEIKYLFPVQASVMPDLLNSAKGPLLIQSKGIAPSDICVCAPTGCGKTLAYVIPLVNALITSNVCRLRALVVVPSQDLALQVMSVFKSVSKGTAVKIGVFCGQQRLEEEIETVVSPLGSKVDILVCTPGRLVSHLQQCSILSMSDLRYLVIDEADRIFEQSYHNWLSHVIGAMQRPPLINPTASAIASSSIPFLFPSLFCSLPKLSMRSTRTSSSTFSSSATVADLFPPKQPLQKLLFSATLSLDPEKLSLLRLNNPKLYSVSPVTGENVGDAVLPSTLSEYTLVCKPDYKPLFLLHILQVLEEGSSVLCFTHSKLSTHRLKLVLQQYEVEADEISASVSKEARKAILKRFGSGKIKVCSGVIFVSQHEPLIDNKCMGKPGIYPRAN